ncbi:MAG: hypothetical protein RLZZ293_901 [Pseudomonadota bacterium]|jgi:phospholipid-binding lipoprotein MlaA
MKINQYTPKILILACGLTLASCASNKNPNDPYESYNRKVFAFNMVADHYVVRPAAVGYTYIIPEPIRTAASNFYNNLRDVISLANDILQLNGINTMHTTMRIALNSTFGLLGFIDVASGLGLPQDKNTFGNTMKKWGWKHSSYFIVPFLGPGTIRDQVAILPDTYFNPLFYVIKDPVLSWSVFGVDALDQRSQLFDHEKLLDQALDPYAAMRDVYLQSQGEYIQVNENESANSESIEVDQLIDEENGESTIHHTTKVNHEDPVDQLIDEENNKANQAVK